MSVNSEAIKKLSEQVESGVDHILFVCKGNLCRSPVAEGVLKNEISRMKMKRLTTRSAGLIEIDHRLVVEELFRVAEEFGVSLKDHTSAVLTKKMMEAASLVFVMEDYQKGEVIEKFPEHKDKVFILSLFDHESNGVNINDPLGTTDYQYRYCFNRIYQLIQDLMDFLNASNSIHNN